MQEACRDRGGSKAAGGLQYRWCRGFRRAAGGCWRAILQHWRAWIHRLVALRGVVLHVQAKTLGSCDILAGEG